MHPSSNSRRLLLLLFTACVGSPASSVLAGTNSIDLATSIEQVVAGPAKAGQPFGLNWVISNNAENVSSQALGQLQLDANSEFVEASCPSTFEAGVLTWTPPSVALAEPRQCLVTVRSLDAGTLRFDVTVDPAQGDSDFDKSNNAASVQVTIEQGVNEVDLAVTLDQVVCGPVILGAGFELRWVLANNREGSISSAAASVLQLPNAVEFIGTSCPSSFEAGVVTWTPPSVDSASPRQCVVTLRSTGIEAALLTFDTQVSASPEDTDLDLANNSATLQVAIERGAVVARELPAGGWPSGLAMVAGLIACAALIRRRIGLAARGSWAR